MEHSSDVPISTDADATDSTQLSPELPTPAEGEASSETQPGSATSQATSDSTPQRGAGSVVVMFKAAGGAPILKQTKFKIQGGEKFIKAVDFLRKLLHRDSVFVYLNSAFSPAMDELISTLYEGYGLDGKLVVNYSITPAW
eukprot:CAMPEP_0198202578 /NCGR_PEP_ID=MMETSP1445-20131203/5763_1 /TAXON_ID=36898 /ORGANISM="Pyramimonas sp., Strain CCMP2087" /LENGTH=140 /DNA_ID=CAMNT_0043873573 /DNA_START=535 /DNA_END=954 /DNA_ORIENTATION=+